MALSDFQTLVDNMVREVSELSDADRDRAITLAVERYNKDRPRTAVEDLVSPGGYRLPLPAAWEPDFSELQSIEHPIGNDPVDLLMDWTLYQTPTGYEIALDPHHTSELQLDEKARATFTIKHLVDATNDTVPRGDREAVSAWAAANLCEQLANAFSGDSDSVIQSDSVDHGSKAQEFARRATSLRRRYFNELGIDPKRSQPAGVVVDLDSVPSTGGRRLLKDRINR